MADNPVKPVDNRQDDGTFGPGNNANPNGRPPKGFAISDVMRQMLNEKPEIKKALSAKLFELALGGDLAAIREVMDRMEGKSPQPTKELNSEDWEEFLHIYKPEKNKE